MLMARNARKQSARAFRTCSRNLHSLQILSYSGKLLPSVSCSYAVVPKLHYLEQSGLHDPAVIEELGIGFASGGKLRRNMATPGYSFESLLDLGLVSNQGHDAFCQHRRAGRHYH